MNSKKLDEYCKKHKCCLEKDIVCHGCGREYGIKHDFLVRHLSGRPICDLCGSEMSLTELGKQKRDKALNQVEGEKESD